MERIKCIRFDVICNINVSALCIQQNPSSGILSSLGGFELFGWPTEIPIYAFHSFVVSCVLLLLSDFMVFHSVLSARITIYSLAKKNLLNESHRRFRAYGFSLDTRFIATTVSYFCSSHAQKRSISFCAKITRYFCVVYFVHHFCEKLHSANNRIHYSFSLSLPFPCVVSAWSSYTVISS